MTVDHLAVAGTLESCDAMVTIEPFDDLQINVESTVKELFGDAILEQVKATLNELGITAAKVHVQDRGAFDCTISARVEGAVLRAGKAG